MSAPDWVRRFSAVRTSLPTWASHAQDRATFTTTASGVVQVCTWDLATDATTQVTHRPEGTSGGRLTPDGSDVVWFDDAKGDERGRWVAAPFEGGEPRPLVPGLEEGWPAGLSIRPGRLAVGVATGDTYLVDVVDDGGRRRIATSTHDLDVAGLSADAALLALGHAEHGDVLHPRGRIINALTGAVVVELDDGPGTTAAPLLWARAPGDQRIVVASDRTGRQRPEVLDARTGRRHVPDLDHLDGDVWVSDWYPDGSALLCAHDHMGRTELWHIPLDGSPATPIDVPEGSVSGARVRDDGALWYAFQSSARPPQIRVRDDAGDRILLDPPGERAPGGQPYTPLRVRNDVGEEVHGFVVTPDGPGPFPLVVDVHGGPMAHTSDTFDPRFQAWVDHGYAVVSANYRGSTGYGKDWEDRLTGNPGFPEVADVEAAATHLVEAGVADPDRIVLTGRSWGGYVTLLGLGRVPERWAVGIAVVPVADYVAAYEDEAPGLQALDRTLFGGAPDEVGDLYRERSPITYADQVAAPVLIITGANDTRCPKRQIDNYVEALRRRGQRVDYEVYDAGHGSLDVAEQIRHHHLALAFAAEHLGTTPPLG